MLDKIKKLLTKFIEDFLVSKRCGYLSRVLSEQNTQIEFLQDGVL